MSSSRVRHHDPHELDRHATEMYKDHVLVEKGGTDQIRAFYLRHKDRVLYGRMQSTYFLFHQEGITICGDLCPGGGNRNSGVTSCFGYGLEWFVGRLSRGYLAEKFLDQGWHRELAADWCEDRAHEILRGEYDWRLSGDDDDRRREELEQALSIRRELREVMATVPKDDEEVNSLRKSLSEARKCVAEFTSKMKTLRREMADEFLELGSQVGYGEVGMESFREAVFDIDNRIESEDLGGWGYHPWEVALLSAIQKKFAEQYWLNQERAETSIGSVDLSELLPGGVL